MNPIPIRSAKRTLDIIMSCLVMIVLFPFTIILLVIFVIEQICIPSSRGPLFYKETRISQGKPFQLWKIRTFKMTALANAIIDNKTIHTKELEKNRSNLTYTGRLLRQIYMDEIPQIFSVLIGDMSFVGPRPTNPFNYNHDIAIGLESKKILKAGLTGTFQTHKHVKYHLNQEKVDMEYAELCKTATGLQIVKHDLFVLLQTAVTVLRAEGL